MQQNPERFNSFSDASHASFDNLCLFLPWFTLIASRVKFTLLEFWLFSIVCGVSLARMLATLLQDPHCNIQGLVVLIYLAAHMHAAFFSAVGEALHFKNSPTSRLSWYRMAWFAITQFVPFAIASMITLAASQR